MVKNNKIFALRTMWFDAQSLRFDPNEIRGMDRRRRFELPTSVRSSLI